MPSNQNPLGALPARFRRERVLIVGCGDVGLRTARRLRTVRTLALVRDAAQVPFLRAQGITPLYGDLDDAASLQRLAGLATRVLHLAPPPSLGTDAPQWWLDARTTALARALRRRSMPHALVYGSTTGVYGDCAGDWVSESRPVAPVTARAQRRVNAERALRHLGRAGVRVSILRIPGIYAPDRAGGTPRARLLQGTPVLRAQDDVYTNHIHADDLARACLLALWRGRAQRVVQVSDASALRMGEYFDYAADCYGLERAPRITRLQAQTQLTPLQLSFWSESRRLLTMRMQRELRLVLHYPTVVQGLGAACANAG